MIPKANGGQRPLGILTVKDRIAQQTTYKMKLEPIFEDGQFTGGKKNKIGTSQGGVISPLLANIYLHLLERIVNNPQSVF